MQEAMKQKAKFISFEGIEGCGKSTQIYMLKEFLENNGLKVKLTREPGGCPIAVRIREILLDIDNVGLVSKAELLLYAAARAQHVEEVIKPALDDGYIVLSDRYADSSEAYQGYGRQLDTSLIDTLNQIATGGLWPEMTLWLDVPVETGLARAIKRNGQTGDESQGRFEAEEKNFHERCRTGFEAIYNRAARFTRIDADDTPEIVFKRIKEAVVAELM